MNVRYLTPVGKAAALLLLTMAFLLSAASCSGDGQESTGAAETTASPVLTETDLSAYVMIRAEDLNLAGIDRVRAFRERFGTVTGLSPAIDSDFSRKGITDEIAAAREILIGNTNRPESARALEQAQARSEGEQVYVVAVMGPKIVINGTDAEALERAMTYFLETTLTSAQGARLMLEENYFYSASVAAYAVLGAGGTDAPALVISDLLDTSSSSSDTSDKKDPEAEWAAEIRAAVEKVCGAHLEFRTDLVRAGTDTSGLREILFGETDRPEYRQFLSSLAVEEYGFAVTGNKLVIAGHTLTTLNAAKELFIDYISASGKTAVIPQDLRRTEKTDRWLTEFPAFDSAAGHFAGAQDAGDGALQLVYSGTTEKEYAAYLEKLEKAGWSLRQANDRNGNLSAILTTDAGMIHALYVPAEKTVRLITAKAGEYELPVLDAPGAGKDAVPVRLTQMAVHHESGTFGTCYVVTLSDNSVIVMDGGLYKDGCGNDQKLYELLKSECGGGKIVIAGWILSHDHSDHFLNFYRFVKKYAGEITLEKIYCNIPEENFVYNSSNPEFYFSKYYSEISSLCGGVSFVKLHTGTRFYIRGAEFEVLCTQEDLYPGRCTWFNDVSMVLRMCAGAQTVLFTADAGPAESAILEARYGTFLKSDLCTVAHHGYSGLSAAAYRLIAPRLYFWPASQSNFDELTRSTGKAYSAADRYLSAEAGVPVLVAEKTVSAELPCTGETGIRTRD